MAGVDDYPQIEMSSAAEWAEWLAAHHATHEAVWLVVYKKHVPDRYLAWGDIVREALAWGWIDSRRRGVDADRTSMLVTRRKPGSTWSAINKEHIAALEAEGRLQPVGRALVEAAKADGSWTFLDDIDALVVPPDLERALTEAGQYEAWLGHAKSPKKLALFNVKTAKRPATRARRIASIVERLAAGKPPAA